MKVLLKEDVENLGYAGEVCKVAGGYGRNYLIPKGMAVLASPNVMKQAEVWRKRAEVRRAEIRAEHESLSVSIEQTTLTFTARAGDTGKLYGSVTTAQITDTLNETLGTEIDRRKVGTDPLRQLGEHKVVVRLSSEFQPHVTVVIESEDGQVSPAVDADEDASDEADIEPVDDEVTAFADDADTSQESEA
ncbi:MAG: 50S ribosomal protein L9 [Chloroflexi bacterium]|jgi:large subunit ribosomal protein L9|nr:50S ribosomal protein L9 [Chloroflexota bacterium]